MNRRLRFLLLLLVSYAGAQSLLRLILFFTSWRETSLLPMDLLGTFALGILYDIAAGIFFYLPTALWLLLLPTRWLNQRLGRGFLLFSVFAANFAMVFTMVAPVPVLAGVPYEFQFYRGRLSGLYSGNAGHDPGVL